jgi:hypothetical protein
MSIATRRTRRPYPRRGLQVLALTLAACRAAAPPNAPQAGPESSPQQIRAMIGERVGSVSACYERALARDVEAGGHIQYRITISAGAVTDIQPLEDTVHDERMLACTLRVIGSWQFPASPTPMDMTFTVVFSGAP